MATVDPRADETSAGGRASARGRAMLLRGLTPGTAARWQAYLFAAAGFVGAVGVLLPHPERFDEVGMLAVQISSMTGAVLLFVLGRRTPRWLIAAGPYAAASLTSVVIVFSGSSTSAYLLFYLWVAFYAFYFLSRRQAAFLAAFAMANYAAVVIGFRVAGDAPGPRDDADISALVLITGTVAVAGVFIVVLRERLAGLIDKLTDAASSDPLTGLLNRRGLHRTLEMELARHERSRRPFSLLLGDCDFFKRLNDRLGHHAGDDALVRIGGLLESHKRRIDVAARFGGEEFALVLPEADEHEAYLVAERLRHRVGEAFGEEPVPLTMSFGVAAYPTHGASADQLMRTADDALYAAKALGRDRTVLSSAEIEELLAARGAGMTPHDEAKLATVLALAEALDMRDTGTARHSQTVGRYCELMARELGLPPARVERIRVAGILHDIGKISVPDAILRKAGPLTDSEYEQMCRHPEAGARLLGGSGLDDIRAWVLAHHERPDGAGYPRRLADADIPLEARILAVGDAYEAMTSDRVYRHAIGSASARRELRSKAGTQFDGRVVAVFMRALDREQRRGRDPARSDRALGK